MPRTEGRYSGGSAGSSRMVLLEEGQTGVKEGTCSGTCISSGTANSLKE
ncbi:hypothetical protein KNP414_06919 [Paenibacillus mucilaginosus KNP414]|uniref:Uncharacterized protein n=1 Tax=Paenibacillus mucilaginosus (strain KNP414) TaxID=1036673 RepID=F8FGQ4_PAEMK|nr:hypothetical protein KNP414_06919 [Paenibacillus mucilaginosus KNP414]